MFFALAIIGVALHADDLPSNLHERGTPSLSELARANSQALASIHSLLIQCNFYSRVVKGTAPDPRTLGEKDLALHFTWTWRGDEQRLQLERLNGGTTAYGAKLGLTDNYNGPTYFKGLKSYDPTHPVPKGEESLSPTIGVIAPHFANEDAIGLNPKIYLLLEVPDAKEHLTLEALIGRAQSSHILATPSTSSRQCYEIVTEDPLWTRHISVDPKANFMIRRIESLPGTQNKSQVVSGVSEVTAFHDFGNGVFLPTTVIDTITRRNSSGRITRLDCKPLSVNKSLPLNAFDIKFFDGLYVSDLRTGKIHIWGNADSPRLTFPTAKAYKAWDRPQFLSAKRALERRRGNLVTTKNHYRLIICGIFSAVIMLAAILSWAIFRAKRGHRADAE